MRSVGGLITVALPRDAATLWPGLNFAGRYVIARKLGEGGMGAVYIAQDNHTQEEIVLKLIHPDLVASEEAVRRLIAEGLAARKIRHPNVVAVYDVSQHEGRPYLTMEYVRGVTLREWMKQRIHAAEEVAFIEAVGIVRSIVEGLAEAHRMGLVHRDLKPENLVLCGNPKAGDFRLKILDFGIAKDLTRPTRTVAGAPGSFGTPFYMAPEQIMSSAVGPAADFYSLTVIFYELLHEGVPHPRAETVSAHRADVPKSLDALIERGLLGRAKSRFQSGTEYAKALDELVTAAEAQPAPMPELAAKPELAPRLGSSPTPELAPKPQLHPKLQSGPKTEGEPRIRPDAIAVEEPAGRVGLRAIDEAQANEGLGLASKPVGEAAGLGREMGESFGQAVHRPGAVDALGRFVVQEEASLGALPKVRVVLQIGHTRNVNSVALAPDGRTALSASDDTTVKLWDVASGRLLGTFHQHGSRVEFVTVAPDGRTALSGRDDLKLWDIASGCIIRTFQGSRWVDAAAFAPDGRTVLLGGAGIVELWDVESGIRLRTFRGHRSSVTSIAFAPDGRTALSGSSDKTLKLWDIDSGGLIHTFEGHAGFFKGLAGVFKGLAGEVTCVAFAPDGRTALSGSDDKTLKLWDISSRRPLITFERHTDKVKCVAFAPDGRTALSGSSDKTLKLWDIASGSLLHTFEDRSSVTSIAFASDGPTALSGGEDNKLKLWDIGTGGLIRTFEGSNEIVCVAFGPDGRTVLSGSYYDATLTLWDIAAGCLIRSFKGHSFLAESVAFAPDGGTFISGAYSSGLKLWETASGRMIRTVEEHYRLLSVAFAPDGRTVLSGGNSSLKLWEIASGRLVHNFENEKEVRCVAFSPDGRAALSASKEGLKLWDIATAGQIRVFERGIVTSVSFAPDGATILSVSADKTLKLWDVASGRILRTFGKPSDCLRCVAFAPDGRTALSGSDDKTLKLWDIESGRLLHTLEGHDAAVSSVAFSPNGRAAISGSKDSTLKLWDVTNGKLLATFLSSGSNWIVLTQDLTFTMGGNAEELISVISKQGQISFDEYIAQNRRNTLELL